MLRRQAGAFDPKDLGQRRLCLRVATARKLAERVYRLLKYGAEYICQEMEAYETAYRKRLVKGLARRAAELHEASQLLNRFLHDNVSDTAVDDFGGEPDACHFPVILVLDG
jgi:hypothetical protein